MGWVGELFAPMRTFYLLYYPDVAVTARTARAVVFAGPRDVQVRERAVDEPGPAEVRVEAQRSAISPGTELLLYRGEVPTELAADVSIDSLDGDLSYPTTYGYATVGTVTETGQSVAADWRGQRVFVFHPHQTQFCASVENVVPVPPALSTDCAVLMPTVETATTLLLDGAPRIGERVVVFGAGTVGLSTTRLLAEYPVANLTVVEPIDRRRELARSFGADDVLDPEQVPQEWAERDPADLVYEVSGQPSALDTAIDVVGYDGRIVVGSWYGSKESHLDLGRRFHRERISIESSQVSTIDPDLRGRWSRERRRETAFANLERLATESLITDRVPLADAPSVYEALDTAPETTIQTLLTYDD